jgi:hypothetical protein
VGIQAHLLFYDLHGKQERAECFSIMCILSLSNAMNVSMSCELRSRINVLSLIELLIRIVSMLLRTIAFFSVPVRLKCSMHFMCSMMTLTMFLSILIVFM